MLSITPPSTSVPTVLPTSTATDSSSTYANEPLIALLRTPLHKMTQDELRKYTMELRTLRLSPQSLGKQLRTTSAAAEAKEEARVPRAPQQSVEDMMKELS